MLLLAFLLITVDAAQVKDERYWGQIQAQADALEFEAFQGKNFSNRELYFGPAETIRAHRYVEQSKKWVKQIGKPPADSVDADDSGIDTFMLEWLVSQHLLAAVELAPKESSVWISAAGVAATALAKLEDEAQEFSLDKVSNLLKVGCSLASSEKKFGASMKSFSKVVQGLGGDLARHFGNMHTRMKPGKCGTMRSQRSGNSPLPTHRFILENPSSYNSKCSADQSQRGSGACLPQLQYTQHQLWPTRIATTRIEIPDDPGFHERLSQMAIKRYLSFMEQAKARGNMRLEDINNAFFSAQSKSGDDQDGRGMNFWPELYKSKEYKLLRKVLMASAIDQALHIGRDITREELENTANLVLWAAVYTTGTPHLSHVHESSAISGTYYSNTPSGVSPIVFMDPRGGQPMHIDAIFPETEPDAPFHHQTNFFPKAGDMVLFPSWLPHRVPPNPMEESNINPRVTWAFNLEVGSNGWMRSTHQ